MSNILWRRPIALAKPMILQQATFDPYRESESHLARQRTPEQLSPLTFAPADRHHAVGYKILHPAAETNIDDQFYGRREAGGVVPMDRCPEPSIPESAAHL